jgi:hypothetical protein
MIALCDGDEGEHLCEVGDSDYVPRIAPERDACARKPLGLVWPTSPERGDR